MPDGAETVWPTVRPVRLPGGFSTVARHLERHPGDVVTLPWRSYRGFSWGNGETASDPALRLLPGEVVVSDDLAVGDVVVDGESPRARAIGARLASGAPVRTLHQHDVTWVLVYRDDPNASTLALAGLDSVYADRYLELLRVPGDLPARPPERADRIALASAYAVPLALLFVSGAVALTSKARGRRSGV
jgi:hypothetical protein